ncbi:GntR family transcriptional regulator [Allosediminivita pacifica]|uniref:DNA-binding GntR family transcriptional regulator n=1 Tax=Allosediminivita pacifica TaxID=1267769 RepID=A0A2T6ANJ4_9RHOB|nr:GntR family transcriptional regulator [Allosediminivita pacifica]PTX45360.1 DNA-binding GntR family transcriptional regulator [Allosediminivita pacifica]GGB20641.1 GntR family transcriptional regulator [Allosediminivita pacifica]
MLSSPDKRLALQAYEKVLELILAGDARPGELVNERRMAETLNMSRTPVRDALLILEGEGLLIRQGRGLQVKQMRLEDFLDALQIRLILEPTVARMAAGHVPDGETEGLRAELQELLALGDNVRADRAKVREIDDRLHGQIADAAGNPQLSQIIHSLRRQTQMFDLRSIPERLSDTCHEHLAIIDAVARSDGETAATAMTAHLKRVQDSIIKRLTRI